jgi:hypothetical protein
MTDRITEDRITRMKTINDGLIFLTDNRCKT